MKSKRAHYTTNSTVRPCSIPRAYGNKKTAAKALAALKLVSGVMVIYRCDRCHRWHIGAPLPDEIHEAADDE